MKNQSQIQREESKRLALIELKKIDYNPVYLHKLFNDTPLYDKSLNNPNNVDSVLDLIMEITLNVFGCEKEVVLSNSRKTEISKTRQALGYLMSRHTNAIQEVISNKINVDRGCLPYYNRVTNKRLKHNIDRDYLSKIREIETIIYELKIN